MAKKVMRKLKEEVEITEKVKERKSKMIASCDYLQVKLPENSKDEGVTNGRQCGNAWIGLEHSSHEAESERKSKKEKVQYQVLAH